MKNVQTQSNIKGVLGVLLALAILLLLPAQAAAASSCQDFSPWPEDHYVNADVLTAPVGYSITSGFTFTAVNRGSEQWSTRFAPGTTSTGVVAGDFRKDIDVPSNYEGGEVTLYVGNDDDVTVYFHYLSGGKEYVFSDTQSTSSSSTALYFDDYQGTGYELLLIRVEGGGGEVMLNEVCAVVD